MTMVCPVCKRGGAAWITCQRADCTDGRNLVSTTDDADKLAAAQAEIERLTKERDEARAQVAAAFEYAAKLCDDTAQEALDESGACSRILWTWFCGQSSAIRALTPADVQASIQNTTPETETALTAQAERIAELEKRLAGLHQATEKMRETANREFHRANRADDNWLRWIAENGLGEEARRARAALKGES